MSVHLYKKKVKGKNIFTDHIFMKKKKQNNYVVSASLFKDWFCLQRYVMRNQLLSPSRHLVTVTLS